MARHSSQRLTTALIALSLVGMGFIALEGCSQPRKPSVQPLQAVAISSEGEADYARAALANVDLGLGYLAEGQMARAKQKLTHALSLAPNLPEPQLAMAFFLEQVGDYSEAEKAHKKAIQLGRKTASVGAVYNNYGAFLYRRGRLQEADHAFQQALQDKQYSHTAEVYENAGRCAVQANNFPAAEQYFSKAIQEDPKRSTALLELAGLKLKNQQPEVAKTLLLQYQGLAQPTARSTWLALQVFQALKEEALVAKHALLLQNSFGDSPEYQQYLNALLGRTGQS